MSAGADAVSRFRASMVIDRDRWRDGIGYDVGVLDEASDEERSAIERILLARGVRDWRDVEALAALDTPRARAALVVASADGTDEVRVAVTRHAPELVSDDRRTQTLVDALERADMHGGLSQAIDEAAEYHPPAVVDALLRGLLARDGTAAVNFAGLLLYIHGKAAEPFDWNRRPFLLRFQTDDAAERRAAYRALCREIEVLPTLAPDGDLA